MRTRRLHTGLHGLLLRAIAIYLNVALLAGPALAQADGAEERPTLKYENATIDMVLKDYSRLTGRTLLISPTVPKNTPITLKNQTELTLQEALDAMETVLSMNGIALIREGEKFLRVVKSDQARSEPMTIIEQLPEESTDPIKDSGELISKMIELKHIDLKEAEAAIKPLMHSYGRVAHFPRVNAMLVTDTAANINRIQQIFGYIDQPQVAREEPKVIAIKYAKASDIKKKLEEIIAEAQKEDKQKKTIAMQKRTGSPGVVRTPARGSLPGIIRARVNKTAAPAANIAALMDAAERGVIRGKVQIVADERTNILIIITRPENMLFFEKIISVLDVPTEPDVMVKIVRLEYAEAETVASTLNSLVGKKGKDANNAPAGTVAKGAKASATAATLKEYVANLQKQSGGSGKGISSVGELSSENITILPDKRTNSLIIMARRSDFTALTEIINNMDMMLSQVLIEVVIIQVDLDDTVTSGMHWVQRALIINSEKNGSLVPEGAVAGSLGSGSGDVIPSVKSAAALTQLGGWGASSGLTAYFTHFGLNLDAIVKLVATDTRTQIVSSPAITTTDNTKATLTSNQQKYFLKGNTVDQWGNVRPETEIKDIGLTLEVTPHINKGRNVHMEIMQEASDPGADQQIEGQGSWPTTTKRTFNAAVSVQDRETIVLGGLVRNYKKKEATKVPILGDIPLLGRLFSFKSNNETRAEVVVFITPYVLDTRDEIAVESYRRKDSLNIGGLWERGWSDSELAEGDKKEFDVPMRKVIPKEVEERTRKKIPGSDRVPDMEKVEDKEIKTPEADRAAAKNPEFKGNGPNQFDNIDPDLVDFIRRSEEKWGKSLKRVDEQLERDSEKLEKP